jgi:hypothetical protein
MTGIQKKELGSEVVPIEVPYLSVLARSIEGLSHSPLGWAALRV